MKLTLAAFLAAWLMLIFATLATATDAYEPSALVGLLPYYLASLALFCAFFVSWKGNLFRLALLSALYQATVAGLPYFKYPLFYGTVFDNLFHLSLAQAILNTGHIPENTAYFGFTTFHSLAAMISLLSGLSIDTVVKIELFGFPILVQLASLWIALDVLRKRSTQKLAILGAFIAFTFNFTPGPQVLAAFLVILSITQLMQFAKSGATPTNQTFMVPLVLLTLAIVITHHQTAFFAIFAFIGIGLLLPAIKGALKTGAFIVQRIELVGLLALGFAYVWWTYYAGFTDLVRNVFSIIVGEPLGFQTTVGRGISYYGPVTWAFRTVIHYAQRGQLLVWTTVGLFASGILLLLRRKSSTIDTDTHAVIFSYVTLFLGVYIFFLFVPFFVIGSDRFFRFISFVSPPFIAIGLETFYSLCFRAGSRVGRGVNFLLERPILHMAVTFLLLVFVFVELLSPLLLSEVYAASSEYQFGQIIFVNQHAPSVPRIISHLVVVNQFYLYAPNFNITRLTLRPDSVSILYSVYSTKNLPSDSRGTLILMERVGPAGTYFEAINSYSNATWVTPALNSLLGFNHLSIVYNSGEAFDVYST